MTRGTGCRRGGAALPLQEPPPPAVDPGVSELVEGPGAPPPPGTFGVRRGGGVRCGRDRGFGGIPCGEGVAGRARAFEAHRRHKVRLRYRGGHVRVCVGDAVAGHFGGHGCASARFGSLCGLRVFQ